MTEGNWTEKKGEEMYTKVFGGKVIKPSIGVSMTILTVLFTIIGSLIGYMDAMKVILLSEGATYDQISKLSLIYHPFLLKFLLAPIVDSVYVKNFGRSKTYIFYTGIMISVLLYNYGLISDESIKELKVGRIVAIWLLIVTFLCIFYIASDAWIVTILDEENKSKGSSARYVGMILGKLFSFNLFIPLNSPKFVDDHFFPSSPRNQPLITNSGLMKIYATLILFFIIYLALFVSEKKINPGFLKEKGERVALTPKRVWKQIPVYLNNKIVRAFLIYILLTRSFESFINEPTKLKMIEFGVDRTTFVNVYGMVIPLEILLSYMSKKYLVKGKMVTFYHYFLSLVGKKINYLTFLIGVSILFKYLINVYLRIYGYNSTVLILILCECLLYSFTKLKYVFLMGFRNIIVDEELGSTSMTIITSTWFLSLTIPNTIGLSLAEHLNYDFFSVVCLFLIFGCLFFTYPMAKTFDESDPNDFKIIKKKYKAEEGDDEENQYLENNGEDSSSSGDEQSDDDNEDFDDTMI